jgi:Lar family restriction alleviation protein
MNDKKPCPFCGNEAIFIYWQSVADIGECYVYCNRCFSRGSIQRTQEKAIAAWNDRIRKTSSRQAGSESTPFIAIVKYPLAQCWTARDMRWPNIKAEGRTPEDALRALRTKLEERDFRAIEWLADIEYDEANI